MVGRCSPSSFCMVFDNRGKTIILLHNDFFKKPQKNEYNFKTLVSLLKYLIN